MNFSLLLPGLLLLAQAVALADGGAVQLRQKTGGFLVTVFTSPTPLAAGPVDVSVLIQTRDELEPVLDANVTLLLREEDSGIELHERLTREQARNKLLYAAMVYFSRSGKWHMVVKVARDGAYTLAAGDLDVAPARDG